MTLTPFGEAIALLKELHFAGDDGELGKRVEAFLSVHSPHPWSGEKRPTEAVESDVLETLWGALGDLAREAAKHIRKGEDGYAFLAYAQVLLAEDDKRRNAPARPPKPKECEVECPPQQVCDHCQWPPAQSDKLERK